MATTDSFANLTAYIKTVKPYHTQLLDTVSVYNYNENVSISISEQFGMDIDVENTVTQSTYLTGYGIRWDESATTGPDAPTSHNIIKAVNVLKFSATFTASSSTINCSNTFVVGDLVVFESDTSLPTSLNVATVAGTIFKVLTATSTTFTVATETGTTAIVWQTPGSNVTVRILDADVNYFDIAADVPTAYSCVAIPETDSIAVCTSYPISAVTVSSKLITVTGNVLTGLSPITVGDSIYVRSNTTTSRNATYTVAAVTISGGNTRITTVEAITSMTVSGVV